MRRPPVDVSIITSGHNVADARLHRQVAALVERGARVEVLGLGLAADGPPAAAVRTWRRRRPEHRALLAASLAARARGRVVITLDPDAALAAAAVTRLRRRALVVDAHEDYAALLSDRAWARGAGGAVGWIAHGVVRAYLGTAARADLTVVADEHVPPLSARRRLVLPNLPYPGMLPGRSDPDPRPRAIYVGDVRESRGLFVMFEAMRAAPDWVCDVVGPVAPGDLAELNRRLAAEPEMYARLRLHGRRPPGESWARAAGAWCGLLLLGNTRAFRHAVPSKLYEYLACGLPVLASDLPRQAALLRETGAGRMVPLADQQTMGGAVADILNEWSADPDRLLQLRENARAAATHEQENQAHYMAFADAVTELA